MKRYLLTFPVALAIVAGPAAGAGESLLGKLTDGGGDLAGDMIDFTQKGFKANDSRESADAAGKGKPGGHYDDFGGLTAQDRANDAQARGGPSIPSKCPSNTGCRACYEKSYADLQHLRFAFLKLKSIGSWTENFTKKSLAFGDDVSAIHGVAGIGWQAERSKIEQSYANFGKQYDDKYNELSTDLENALRGIGKCEAQYFGADDWYDRYGYIYYAYQVDSAKRSFDL